MTHTVKRSALLTFTLVFLAAAAAESDAIRVQATPVPLSADEPGQDRVGALVYRGGVVLTSDDRRFGGLSGLHVSPDGSRLLAVSDLGGWLEARLDYDKRGFLTGVSDADMGLLVDPDGRPLADKSWQDAESLTVLGDGSALVGFERQHRLWKYRGAKLAARPEIFPPPPGLERAPPNGGLEALAALKDGGLLALTEEMPAPNAMLRGFLWRDGKWSALSYRPIDAPRPSDATVLPNGDVLVLERSYSPILGLLLRLRRIAHASLVPGATLDPPVIAELKPPLSVDNLEGISARQDAKGETLIYLISDDNFNRLQKTLLLMFALKPDGGPPVDGRP